MKRSETVLVYGVTALLLVILGIAVIFGNEPVGPGPEVQLAGSLPGSAATTNGLGPSGDILDQLADKPEDGTDPSGAASPGGEGSGAGELGASDPSAAGAAGTGPAAGWEEAAGQPGVPLRTVHAVLGASEVVDQFGTNQYRVVEVRSGQTFSELVQNWCGDLRQLDLARALNEDVDLDRLQQGQKLWLPLVADEVLLQAWTDRLEARRERLTDGRDLRRPAAAGTAPGVTPPVATGAAQRDHVVKSGESLWTIAVREVGARRAKAYIDEIVALNNLSDPDRLKVDAKLALPAH